MAIIWLPRRYSKLLVVIGSVILTLVLLQSFRAFQIKSVDVLENQALRDVSESALRESLQTLLPNLTAKVTSGDTSGNDKNATKGSAKDSGSVVSAAEKILKSKGNSSDSKAQDENEKTGKDVVNDNEDEYDNEKEKDNDQHNDDKNSSHDSATKDENKDNNDNNDEVHHGNDNKDIKPDENSVAKALLSDTEQVARRLQSNCSFYKDAKPIDLQKTLQTMRFYVKNPDVCRASGELLIYIHSAPAHFERRQAVRETWGKKEHLSTLNATMVFVTGYVTEKPILKRLRQEIRQHRDLVVAGFVDSYFNMTLKALTAMKWTMTYCNKRRYILKLDDDIFVGLKELKKLIDYLKIFYSPNDTLVACYKWQDAPVARSGDQKWCVSEYEFPSKVFPPYCAGAAVLYNNITLETLYNVASKMSYFWIDDVFITGILTQQLGIEIRPLNNYCALFDHEIGLLAKDRGDRNIMFYHTLKSSIMHLLWRLYSDRHKLT